VAIAMDAGGSLYVADEGNNRIRVLIPARRRPTPRRGPLNGDPRGPSSEEQRPPL
jgi:hypothetical protein